MSTCPCKTLKFTVLVTVPTTYEDATNAAQYLRDRIEDAEKELAENAENDSLTPSSFLVTTGFPEAADRAGCLAGVCER